MGKGKSRTKAAPKKRMEKLDTHFSCPFCNHGFSTTITDMHLQYELVMITSWRHRDKAQKATAKELQRNFHS